MGGVWRRSSRILACSVVLAAAASLSSAAAPPQAAAVQTDLGFISRSTWTADPVDARVHVVADVTVTSHTLDTAARRYFYDSVQMTLPASSTAFLARTPGGTRLGLSVDSVTSSASIISVDFGRRLYSGQSTSFSLYFDLVDNGGSTDRDLRIGNNLMSFPVTAFGTPGTPGSSVSVIFPAGFTVQEEFGGLTRSLFGSGQVVFSSGVLDDSTELSAWFTAVQPVPQSDFRVRSVVVGPLRVNLKYWVDDPGWADQVERVMLAGYPLLTKMIGLGNPIMTSFTVEEASTQESVGFSGSYDEASGGIQVSYFADPFVILHEMAHMWFNSSLLGERWMQEGFASYYAEQVVNALGYTDHAPVLTDRLLASAIPLNDWTLAGQPSSATDGYLYGATLEVAREIAALAGQDGLRKIWLEARAAQAAYQPAHGPANEILAVPSTDWRRLLDLLEQTTGQSYGAVWRQWVIDPAQDSLLQQRATALAAYTAAQKAAGSWNLPPEIRRSLDGWQFDQALAFMSQARGILTQRDQIANEAATELTTPPPTLQAAFEDAGIGAAGREASQELEVLAELAAADLARTNSGGAARDLGLLGADPQAELTAARQAFAGGDLSGAAQLAVSARNSWESANSTGQVRIVGSLSLLAGCLLLLGLYVWMKGGRPRAVATAGGLASDAAAVPMAGEGVAGEAALSGRGPPLDLVELAATEAGTNGVAPDSDGNGSEDDPDESAYELLQRGHALLKDHHNAQAAVVLERAARLEQSKGSILEALGRAYFNSGQHERAAETFQALLEIDPSAHYGHFALGLSFARLGRPQEARTHLRLAVALDPASETYRRALDRMETAVG